MEDKIYTICAELKVGEITVNEATDRLLILFNVSGSSDKETLELLWKYLKAHKLDFSAALYIKNCR